MAEGQGNGRIARLRARLLAGIGGFAAIGLSLGLALYARHEAPAVPTLAAGIPLDAGRWRITVRSARLADRMPNGNPVTAGRKALVVETVFENLTAATSNLYAEALRLDGVAGAARPVFFLERDGDLLEALQPRLAEAVAVVFALPEAADMRDARLAVVAERFKPRDNLYAAPGWFDPHDAARVALPPLGDAGA